MKEIFYRCDVCQVRYNSIEDTRGFIEVSVPDLNDRGRLARNEVCAKCVTKVAEYIGSIQK